MTEVPANDRPPDFSLLLRQAQAWVVRLDSQAATVEDAQAFRRWCSQSPAHARAFAQVRQVWQTMRDAARHMEHELPSTAASVSDAGQRSIARLDRRAFLGGAVAASAAYLALRPPLQLWPSLSEWASDYRTGTGEQRAVSLPAGVVVQMNTQTRINVRGGAEEASGIELVAGEAEIAASGRGATPFAVTAGDGVVRAHAATFNVRHTGAPVCVTCLAGEVEIEHRGRRVTLGPNQQITYAAGNVNVQSVADPAAVSAWRHGRLVFDKVPLALVIEEVNRYRPGKIILASEALRGTLVQASFSIDRLDDVTVLIRKAYGAELTQLPGGIVLVRGANA